MQDWNVVVTTRERGFILACELLEEYGRIDKTNYFNVLAMRVEDVHAFLEGFRKEFSEDPSIQTFLARVMPVTLAFAFRTPEEFEAKAGETALHWVRDLGGKGFHVRVHRRGFKHRLSGTEEEHLLADVLLESLVREGTPGRITFEDPDAVLAVETIGQRAGMSLWSREEMGRYPFLKLD